MNQVLKKSWDKSGYLIMSGLILTSILLLTIVYKSDEKIVKKSENIQSIYESSDLKTFKEFILNQIKSPYSNVNYEIKKGDTIQKILQKYNIQNREIQSIIVEFKKYSNPNQLLVGNKIDFIIEENSSKNKSSLIKFLIPITKSSTIEITKD